ncbi:MAG: hypothetical protein ACRDKZ_15535 [Actinomycetota bacterium]
MSLKRLMMLLLLGFALFFLVQSPAEAAKVVKMTGQGVGEFLGTAAESLSQFVKSLV